MPPYGQSAEAQKCPKWKNTSEISTEINFWYPDVEFLGSFSWKYWRPGTFQYMGPKMGVGPPLGGILNKFSNFLSSSSSSMYRGLTMQIWAISANLSCLQDICCHFCQNLSPGAALGYLRNGALDRKTFLVKVGWYEVFKAHWEFGEVWWFSLGQIGYALKNLCLNKWYVKFKEGIKS